MGHSCHTDQRVGLHLFYGGLGSLLLGGIVDPSITHLYLLCGQYLYHRSTVGCSIEIQLEHESLHTAGGFLTIEVELHSRLEESPLSLTDPHLVVFLFYDVIQSLHQLELFPRPQERLGCTFGHLLGSGSTVVPDGMSLVIHTFLGCDQRQSTLLQLELDSGYDVYLVRIIVELCGPHVHLLQVCGALYASAYLLHHRFSLLIDLSGLDLLCP